jgi:signal transduction histidine kinase
VLIWQRELHRPSLVLVAAGHDPAAASGPVNSRPGHRPEADDASATGVRMLMDLTRAATGVARSGTVRAALDNVAAQVMIAAEASACSVILYDAATREARHIGTAGHDETYIDSLLSAMKAGAPVASTATFVRHEPIVMDDLTDHAIDPLWSALAPHLLSAGWAGLISVPILDNEVCMGVVAVFFQRRDRVNAATCAFVSALADYVAIAVQNARLLESVRALTVLEQRQSLARDIHDSVIQNMFSLTMHVRVARMSIGERPDLTPPALIKQLESSLGSIEQMASAIQQDMRQLIAQRRPQAAGGLVERLRRHVDDLRSITLVNIRVVDELLSAPVLSVLDCEELFLICREAINNSVKHASAANITVTISRCGDSGPLRIEVADDGTGFLSLPAAPGDHVGLSSMRERADRLGNQIDIRTSSEGTSVCIEVPLTLVLAWA